MTARRLALGAFLLLAVFSAGHWSARLLASWPESGLRRIVDWGERLAASGTSGGGWTCTNATDDKIRQAASAVAGLLDPAAVVRARNMNLVVAHPRPRECFTKAENRLLAYDAELDVVYGVWRCSSGDLVGEFQIAIYREQTPVSTDQFCTYAMFYEDLAIPLGAVTAFWTP